MRRPRTRAEHRTVSLAVAAENETRRQIERYTRRHRRYDLTAGLVDLFIGRTPRRKLFADCAGRLLEVGIGTGGNFRYYPKGGGRRRYIM